MKLERLYILIFNESTLPDKMTPITNIEKDYAESSIENEMRIDFK